ncbi:MAG: hypothetical protein ACYDHB_08265 [Candidatus Dormibacteria bacterium]
MATAGALGLVAVAVMGADPVSAATASPSTPTSGTLYFTCYANQGTSGGNCQTGSDVQKATYSYDGSSLHVGAATAVANTQGADGIQFLRNGNLVVGGQSSGKVSEVDPSTTPGTLIKQVSAGVPSADHISISPVGVYSTQLVTVGGYGGGGLAVLPIDASGHITAGVPCSLTVNNTKLSPAQQSSFVMDTVVWVGTQAYYTESTNTGDPYDGFGAFGTINIDYTSAGCTASLTQLLPATASGAGFPAAHGMTYDSYSKSLILFGSTMIAQIPVTAGTALTSATPVSEITFNNEPCTTTSCYQVPSSLGTNSQFDQGTADGLGHLFVSDNNGNMVFVDYSQTPGLIAGPSGAPSYVYDSHLTNSLDDVATFPLEVNTYATPVGPVPLGTPLLDQAQVINAPAGGTVSFQLFAPNQTCSPSSEASTFTSGPLTYTPGTTLSVPAAWDPTGSEMPGIYQWLATYTNGAISQTSGCGNEPVDVVIPTAISTQASPGGSPGTSVTDTATVTSHVQFPGSDETAMAAVGMSLIPTGTVSFSLYGPSSTPSCSGTPVFPSATGVRVDLVAGRATSPAVPLTTPGTYYWVASYTPTGSKFGSAVGSCGADNETVTISSTPTPPPPAPNTPTVTTVPSAGGPVGTALSDTAHVTGIVDPGTSDSVSFALYSDPSCTTLADNLGNASLTGPATSNGVPAWTASSPGSGYAPSVAGTYYWGVSFNSVNDPANLSSSPLCGEPVTITASGGTLGAHTTPTPPPAGAVKAASTPTPNTGADLFLPGLLAALALFFGGLLLLTGGKLWRNPGL